MDILIDIETLPIDATVGMDLTCAPGWTPPPTQLERKSPPRNYKDPEKIRAWQAEEEARYALALADELDENREAALKSWRDSVFEFDRVRIATIGVAWDGGSEVLSASDSLERTTLARFMRKLSARGRIITFGEYDAKVIRSRLLAHRMPLGPFAPWRNGEEVKPWDRRIVDLQKLCADVFNGSIRKIGGMSVDRICAHLGIERVANPIDGSQVLDAYVAGRWEDIVAHCAADVRDEWAIWERLMEAM